MHWRNPKGAQLLVDLHHVFNDTHKTRGMSFVYGYAHSPMRALDEKLLHILHSCPCSTSLPFIIVINYLLFPILHDTADQRASAVCLLSCLLKYAAY